MRTLHWFRSDLRLRDNPALAEAVASSDEVVPVFVLDDRLLTGSRSSRVRTAFLLDSLGRLAAELESSGAPLVVRCGAPEVEIPKLLHEAAASCLSFEVDASGFARQRDHEVTLAAEKAGVRVLRVHGRSVIPPAEIRNQAGRGYQVYTPYRRAWFQRLQEFAVVERKPRLRPTTVKLRSVAIPAPEKAVEALPTGGERAAHARLRRFLTGPGGAYGEARDLPAIDGTSRLSPYLRFGVISARTCVAQALDAARDDERAARGLYKWVDQLAWRDFYGAVLADHPHVQRGNHRSEFDGLVWEQDDEGFEAWCTGRTGFPIVDAGMRQLAATGWMHNRVRMIVASFLTKDLLIDWRRGERFFFQSLVDGDPANNNGGWQWAASTGTDAQPYFRIFNPTRQGQRFDPDGRYVRRWVPELQGIDPRRVHTPWEAPLEAPQYPPPRVDHAERRALALERYGDARSRNQKS